MASLTSQVQNDWVADRGGSSTFFGGVNPDQYDQWVDMSGNPMTFFNWGNGEPNGGAGSCATIYWAAWGGFWNDAYCGDQFTYVCQYGLAG